jgi:excinuclease ABC subunit C
MLESRTRPCLQFQIKRCSAPCVGKISEAAYAALVSDAERFLSGKSTTVQADLAARWPRPARRWSSNAPQHCATASAR